VRAINETTLEVKLDKPIAYFPYLLWLPVTFPLPRRAIENWGDEWWKPKHIISNGPYRLVRFEPGEGFELAHNPLYHGEFPGNVEQISFKVESDLEKRLTKFRSGQLDMTWVWREQMDDVLLSMLPIRSGSSQMLLQ
jgi:ABC-type oligopeptide transport system substrate-binding subunit